MGRVRFLGKRNRGRCAYCREAVSAEQVDPCDGCGALVHDACRAELDGCPTLGCAGSGEPTRRAQEDRRAARTEGRRERAEPGRLTSAPPGLAARLGPYGRIVARTALHIGILLVIASVLLVVILNPKEAIELAFEDGELIKAGCIGWFVGMMLAANAMAWLARVPQFLRRTTELLDDGEVIPMQLEVIPGTTYSRVRLTDMKGTTRELDAGGVFEPYWLRKRAGQRVFVHGGPDDEALVIEFADGFLVLIDTTT